MLATPLVGTSEPTDPTTHRSPPGPTTRREIPALSEAGSAAGTEKTTRGAQHNALTEASQIPIALAQNMTPFYRRGRPTGRGSASGLESPRQAKSLPHLRLTGSALVCDYSFR
jgi:hypothetical protein